MKTSSTHAANQYRLLAILVVLLGGSLLPVRASQSTDDHLVPASEYFDPTDKGQTAYWKLLEQKLFVTPADIARFVQFPGATGAETAMAVYQASGKSSGYRVTITQPSSSLWETVPQPGEQRNAKQRPITVERCDAPLPDSAARPIHEVWLTMLRQAKSEPKSESISVDNTIEIFTAVAPDGKTLRGQSPRELVKAGNVSALVDLVNSLIHYCDVPESERADMAKQIERDASTLLKRLQY